MKLYLKFALYILIACIVVSVPITISFKSDPLIFVPILGVVLLLAGGMCLFVGLILLLAKSREYGEALLISAGILFLIGGGTCSTMLLGIN
jgi:hypothetical protein